MAINNVTLVPDAILQRSSEEKVKEYLPVLVFVSIVLFIGILGNILVLIFFFRKAKDNVSSFFIVVLAIVDICACLMISLVIMDLSRPYKYTSDIGCKVHSFSKFFTGLCSILLLFTIAVERYRKICCPFKRQITMKGARIVVFVNVIIAIALSVAQATLYEVIEVNVENDYDITVIGFSCRTTRDSDMRKYLIVLNGVIFFLFILFAVSLVILYSLQSRAIYKHNRKHAKLTKGPEAKGDKGIRDNKTSDHPGPSGKSTLNNNQTVEKERKGAFKSGSSPQPVCKELININKSDVDRAKDDEKPCGSSESNSETPTCMDSNETLNSNVENNISINSHDAATEVSKQITRSDLEERVIKHVVKKGSANKETISPVRVSIMFFVITVGFIACYTAFMVYSVRRSFTSSSTGSNNTAHSVSSSSQFLVNSYLINSTLNFFVYAVVHNDYRRFLQCVFCCCRNTK